MKVNERIRALRKDHLHITLSEFGGRVGVGKSAMSSIETGASNVSPRMFVSICREFNVNPEWLRDGVGDMFLPTREGVLGELQKKYDLNELELSLVEEFLELDPRERHVLVKHLDELLERAKERTLRPLGTPEGIAEAEAAYEKAFGIASKTAPSALNTTGEKSAGA